MELARENKVVSRAQDAGGHHGGGNQHPLSDRQQLARGWHAGVDAVDEAGRRAGGRTWPRAYATGCGVFAEKVVAIAISSRAEGAARRASGDGKLYGELLSLARKVVRQADRVTKEIGGLARRKQRQTKAVVVRDRDDVGASATGDPANQGARASVETPSFRTKIVSVFETHTEIIRKGKASKPTEFGKMVKIQETENQIITDYQVFRPSGPTIRICWWSPSRSTKGVWTDAGSGGG